MEIFNEFMLLVFLSCIISELGVAVPQDDECSVTRCRGGDSKIRFPFHLIHSDKERQLQSDHCGYPVGFELSCGTIDHDNYPYSHYPSYSHYPMVKFEYQVSTSLPGLYLSFSVEAYVESIDYKSRQLYFVSKSTNVTEHSDYYLSDSPFKPFTIREVQGDFTFYKCSSTKSEHNIYYANPSLSGHDFKVYAIPSHYQTTDILLTSCTKLYNISHAPFYGGGLSWSEPDCGDCEAKGQYCKFKPNNT